MQSVKPLLTVVTAAVMAMTVKATVTFTWTGAKGNNLYADKGNWTITGGTSTRPGPSWTEDCIIDTDAIGHDVTIVLNTAECNCNIFRTKGKYKVTIASDGNDHTLHPYHLYLNAQDNEFNVPVSLWAVSSRTLPIDHNATFNKDVKLTDSTTIDNSTTAGASEKTAVHFYGKLTVASGKVLGLCRAPFTNYGAVHFHGPLICDELRFGLGYKSGYAYFYSNENQIGKLGWCYSQFVCCDENVYPSALAVSWPTELVNPANGQNQFYWEAGKSYNALNLNGKSQQAASISYQHTTRRPYISSSEPATLSLIGSGSAVANVIVDGAVTVAVDSDDLVQEFSESASTTSGALAANKGTLKLSGATSFVNVPEITVGAGATFEVNATTIGALGGVTNINVAVGGTLKVGANVSSPFGTKLAIHLADGAFIDTAADFTVANGLFVDDSPVSSDTYASAAWLKGGSTGRVTVNAPNVEATYVWTGAASDGKFSTPGNWQGGNAPVFTSTLATYVFPEAGSGDVPLRIAVDTAVSCKSMNFTCSNGGRVELFAENSGKLTIVNGDLNATNATANAVVARLSVPVEFADGLVVRIGSDDNKSTGYGVAFLTSLNSIGPAEITKYGYGELHVDGENNVIMGNIHNWQGSLLVSGANPVGGGLAYSLNNYPNQGDTKTYVTLKNATVDRNVNTRAPADQCGFTLRAMGQCTINGSVHNNAGGVTSSGHLRFYLSRAEAGKEPTTCVVKGAMAADNNGFFILSGEVGTLRCEGGLGCVRPYCDVDAPAVFLEVAGNKPVCGLAGSAYAWYMAIPLRLAVDSMVYRSVQGDQYYSCVSGSAGIDLNGHRLSLANFNCTASAFAAGGGYVKGGAGSVLTLCGDAEDVNGMRVLEQASLVRAGTGTTTIADVCTSTGSLDVKGGTVKFTASGSWTNVASVTVGGGAGTAKLSLANRKAFAKTTVLKVADNGKVEIAEGVTARVGELYFPDGQGGWKLQPSGTYSAATDPAHFVGGGVLTAGKMGLLIVLQ